MPYLIDSHCHLHDREFFSEEEAEKILKTAQKRNIKQIICVGTSVEDSKSAKNFAGFHENIFWTFGIHPESADNSSRNYDIISEITDQKLVAIGEIGLDYHYPGYDKSAQFRLLEEQIDLAISLDLPCSFHVRDALSDFFAIVSNFSKLKPSVLHSFSDSKENLEIALEKGFYVGMNGLATFANLDCYKNLDASILDRTILETDAPFLTPAPNRGKINEPGNIADIASWLSTKLGVSETEVAEKTTKNVLKLFNLPNPREVA